MNSFIITSRDQEKRKEYILNFCKEHQIDPIDIAYLTKESSVKKDAQSIGVDDVRAMHQKIFLKPVKSKNKLVVFEEAELMKDVAQNALLKVLEEPPENTFIFLSASNAEAFLPTIISRCQVVSAGDKKEDISEEEKKDILVFVEEIGKRGIGERLKKAEVLAKDKEKALDWLEKAISILRKKMLEQADEKCLYYTCVKNFRELHAILSTTNVNTRFALENAFLKLPRA